MARTVEQFIAKWQGASGGERSQSQSFLKDLCQALDLEEPKDGDYKFEFPVNGHDGTNFIDLYRRGCFMLEAKQSRARAARRRLRSQWRIVPAPRK